MAISVLGEKLTTDFINAVKTMGYTSLSERLRAIAENGSYMQQMRIADCWVMLDVDIGSSWKGDGEIREFLVGLERMLQLRDLDPSASLWWFRGAYYVLRHLPESDSFYTSIESFYQRLLEALTPNVLGLHDR